MESVASADCGLLGVGDGFQFPSGSSGTGAVDRVGARCDWSDRSDCRAVYAGQVVLDSSKSNGAGYEWDLFANSQSNLYLGRNFCHWGCDHAVEAVFPVGGARCSPDADFTSAPGSECAGSEVWGCVPGVPATDVVLGTGR